MNQSAPMPSARTATASRQLATAGLLALLLSACASPLPQHPPGADAPGRFEVLTRPFIAIGDTQEHESTGFPLHENDSAVDAFVEVTQRPPEHALFGRRILEWVIQGHAEVPLLHLGDVLDMSCTSELRRLSQIVGTAKQPVSILPGNHDGLLFGIFNYNIVKDALDPDGAKWDRGCRRGGDIAAENGRMASGRAVNKYDFIRAYVSEVVHGPHSHVGLKLPALDVEERVSWRNPDLLGFIEALEIKLVPGSRYASSFIIHKLRLPAAPGATRRVSIIGLDTNQVDTVVGVIDTLRGLSPGDFGHVLDDQLEAITPWIEQAAASGEILIFAGHHNWGRLGELTRLRLATLLARVKHPLVYLSAHTHRGSWAMHRLLSRDILELNVSSLSDWPIAYRRITFLHDPQANRIQVRADLMPADKAPPTTDAELVAAWESQACAASELPVAKLRERDAALVRQQRESRGTLMEWLVSQWGDWCETCGGSMFRHGQLYQDQLLTALAETGTDLALKLGPEILQTLPLFCEGRNFVDCAADLRAQTPEDFTGNVLLFRRKAALADWGNTRLDLLESHRARAYMTCRAVLATKADFDVSDEALTPGGTERGRRADGFFRGSATVGMQ